MARKPEQTLHVELDVVVTNRANYGKEDLQEWLRWMLDLGVPGDSIMNMAVDVGDVRVKKVTVK